MTFIPGDIYQSDSIYIPWKKHFQWIYCEKIYPKLTLNRQLLSGMMCFFLREHPVFFFCFGLSDGFLRFFWTIIKVLKNWPGTMRNTKNQWKVVSDFRKIKLHCPHPLLVSGGKTGITFFLLVRYCRKKFW